jgi:vacuolar-type H+-ATPase subunit I/STV1
VFRIIDIVTRDTREENQIETLHRKFEQLEEITRDRKQVQQRLAETSPGDAAFSELVVRLNVLNARQEELMRVTDLEEMMSHESEDA